MRNTVGFGGICSAGPPKGNEELVAAARKTMGAGQPDAGNDAPAEGGQYSRFRPWWTLPKSSEAYRTEREQFPNSMAKAMGVRQPEDEAKSDEPGWIMRNMFPVFIRNHNNPHKRAAVEEMKRTVGPAGAKFGLGILEAKEPPPSPPAVQLLEILRPDFQAPKVRDL